MRFRLLAVALLALLPAPPASATDARTPTVSILATAYGTPRTEVLAGDTVAWRNDSVRPHTVSASDGSWGSERLAPHASYTRRFDGVGTVDYYCQVHPGMRAQVDVRQLVLTALGGAAAPGKPFVLTGRAALPAGTAVSIEADGAGAVATATVDAAGGFLATVTPRATTSYRAVAGEHSSSPVHVLVLDRRVEASASRRGVRARVLPASPGATVVLQLHLRERFGWWPVQQAKLGPTSRARFTVRHARPVRARVVLVAADGATPLATSPVVRVR